jgi:hypothetical protein
MGFNVTAASTTTEGGRHRPGYGEAHYALAFMYAMNDLPKGAEHSRR